QGTFPGASPMTGKAFAGITQHEYASTQACQREKNSNRRSNHSLSLHGGTKPVQHGNYKRSHGKRHSQNVTPYKCRSTATKLTNKAHTTNAQPPPLHRQEHEEASNQNRDVNIRSHGASPHSLNKLKG